MLRTMLPVTITKAKTGRFDWISFCSLALVLLLGFCPLPAAARSRHHAANVKPHSAEHHKSERKASRHPRNSQYREARQAHGHGKVHRTRYSGRHHHGARGQQVISQQRTLEIQRALIRQHYMDTGQDTGEWDQATRDALVRYQGDNHWQTKILPDSRALIKLGLGPSRENLLNPESAAIGMPGWPSLAGPRQADVASASLPVAN